MESENKHIYQLRNVPRTIFIKGFELTFKDPPLKNSIYKYRCRNYCPKKIMKLKK